MAPSDIFGTWLAAFLTLAIFSFLYRDNPFYKFAEHLFVGVSAGYTMAINYQEVLKPNLLDNLGKAWTATSAGQGLVWEWVFVVPALLGILMLLRLVPKTSWISRWPLAFLVGIGAGFNIVYTMETMVLKQVHATILPLWIAGNLQQTALNWIIIVGVVCGLIYFYFSIEHKGVVGAVSRVGIYVLMIAFGASFGYTVMARVSLLIGRMMFFRNEWWSTVTYMLGWGPSS